MNKQVKRTAAPAIAVIGATFAAMWLMSGSASAADGIHSTSNDCYAAWFPNVNDFDIRDEDNDGKGCAVLYSFKADHTPSTWIWHPADDFYGYYGVKNPGGDKWIFFKVCDQVGDHEARNCTNWKRYGT